jgi:hypothetical protein
VKITAANFRIRAARGRTQVGSLGGVQAAIKKTFGNGLSGEKVFRLESCGPGFCLMTEKTEAM